MIIGDNPPKKILRQRKCNVTFSALKLTPLYDVIRLLVLHSLDLPTINTKYNHGFQLPRTKKMLTP